MDIFPYPVETPRSTVLMYDPNIWTPDNYKFT